jgi:hypothetical protein
MDEMHAVFGSFTTVFTARYDFGLLHVQLYSTLDPSSMEI